MGPAEATDRMRRALALQASGDAAAALAGYRAILVHYPLHADVLHNAGVAAHALGEVDEAEHLLLTVVRHHRGHRPSRDSLARIWASRDATDDLRNVAASPDWKAALSPETIERVAGALQRGGDHSAAMALFTELSGQCPDNVGLLLRMGQCALAAERFDIAHGHYQAHLDRCGNGDDALIGLGRALLGQHGAVKAPEYWREARAAFETVDQASPAYPKALLHLAEMAEEDGDFVQAERIYRDVLARDPASIGAMAGLAALRNVGFGPDDAAMLRTLCDNARAGASTRAKGLKALGKRLDTAGDYAAAFACFAEANEIASAGRCFDAAAHRADIDGIIAYYSPEMLARDHGGSDSDRPIFIIGMPRSGTTLLEQILSGHPEIGSGGEIGFFLSLDRNGEALHGRRPLAISDVATRYLAILDRIDDRSAHVVDKMPFNFLHAGMIIAAFPRARIIHCERDPRDIGISCFAESFSDAFPFAWRVEDIAAYIADYRRLMDHWEMAAPGRIAAVRYEALISDPEGVTRSLFERLDIAWDERCVKRRETSTVRTPSRWQVRQPIYSSSIDRWKHYADFIPALLR